MLSQLRKEKKEKMQKISEWISDCDLFAVPVKLAFKGRTKFYSVFGGCCSILLVLAMIFFMPLNLLSALKNPYFNSINQQNIKPDK